LNLPACAVCGYRDEAKHMYITGSFDKRYFCTYEEQCVYWFNQGGWQNNKQTIRKLRDQGILMDVYFACNEIGKAILSRYIWPEDIEEHVDLIRYDRSEEVSANEIF